MPLSQQLGFTNPDDMDDDDEIRYGDDSDSSDKPYLSVSDRVSLDKSAPSIPDVPQTVTMNLPGLSGPSDIGNRTPAALPAANPVADYIKNRTMKSQDPSQDPLFQQFLKDRTEMQDLQRAKLSADTASNLGQAFQSFARGTSAPQASSLYENIGKQGQELLGEKEKERDLQRKVTDAIEARQSRRDIATARAQDFGLRQQELSSNRDLSRQDRLDKQQRDIYKHTADMLENARNAPAAAQAEKDIYAADKAKSLANLYGDPNNLSPQMVQLLAGEIGKIAQGGSPTMHELEGLTPQTLSTKFAGITSALLNKPTPANAGAFVKQYQDYSNVLTKDAKKLISERYGRIINSNQADLSEDQQNRLKQNYIDRFNQPDLQMNVGQEKASSNKVVVTNGKETLSIDPSDLEDAMKDGFRRM